MPIDRYDLPRGVRRLAAGEDHARAGRDVRRGAGGLLVAVTVVPRAVTVVPRAVTVVPREGEAYARERVWIGDGEAYDRDRVIERLCDGVAARAPRASFRAVDVGRVAPAGRIAAEVRRVAADVDASLLLVSRSRPPTVARGGRPVSPRGTRTSARRS